MPNVVIWGGTGQAKVIADVLDAEHYSIHAIFDNRQIQSPLEGVPLFVGLEQLDHWLVQHGTESRLYGVVGIGGRHGASRLELMHELEHRGIELIDVIHRSAHRSVKSRAGKGLQMMVGSMVCTHCSLGRGVIINTGASVDHDCWLGDGVHIGPGARLAGEVIVEACAFVGAGAVILPRVRIGADAIVGAGAVVVRDVKAGSTVVGNPARLLQSQSGAEHSRAQA